MAQQARPGQMAPTGAGVGVTIDPNMQRCIDECLHCHSVCLAMASQYCLAKGGEHVEPEHMRLMLACAEICRAAASFMMIGTDLHSRLCGLCADVCEACATSCEEVGEMERCVEACRRCADSCRQMAA